MAELKTQLDKFDLETDDVEARFDDRLRKIAKHEPVEQRQ